MPGVFNFSAGPAALPEAVMDRLLAEIARSLPASPMEISHRGTEFAQIAECAEADLRALLQVPDDYRVLFLQGGATGQFAAVPLNLCREGEGADHLVTGRWSRKAADEASRFTRVAVVADGAGSHSVPDRSSWRLDPDAAYFAYAANETVDGIEIFEPPQVGKVPLVADMSSTILSRPIDVSRFGVVYAGAQKNIGPAGLTVVVVRGDLLGRSGRAVPAVLDWKTMGESGSMLNTPPTFSLWVSGLVFAWLLSEGGLEKAGERARAKKDLLYAAIDGSAFYHNKVDPRYRSWTTVPFVLADPGRDDAFLSRAEGEGLLHLRGHRSVGGMRASLYNSMPLTGVEALVEFMSEFERTHA